MATVSRGKRGVPEGLWIRCPQCKATIFRKEAESRFNVCPECDHHFYLPASERIRQLLDEGSFEEWFVDLRPKDPIGFTDRIPYAQRLEAEQKKTGLTDAAVVGKGYVPVRLELPQGFQTSEFLLQHGFIDRIVHRKDLRTEVARIIDYCER